MKILLNTDSQPGLPGASTPGVTDSTDAAAPVVSTADKLKAIEMEVGNGLTLAANLAGAIDPELLPFIVLGKAAAAAMPGLIDDITGLINGTAPSDTDNASIAATIASLGSPETL